MKVKIAALLLILAGISIIFYPTFIEKYHDRQQDEILSEWHKSMNNINNGEEQQGHNVKKKEETNEPAPENKTSSRLDNYPKAEALLIIDKINFMQPILHGATAEHLNTTVASVEDTGIAGDIGNYAVAGHRNRTYGRNFNRLDEIGVGDNIKVDNGTELFEYTVTEKLIVKPEEVWVLNPNGTDKEITLITCHPMVNPTHRIIVKGKIIEKNTEQAPSL